MKNINIVDKGHTYELHHHEGEGVETLKFIKKVPVEDGQMETTQQGTTNEAVLEALINRLRFLNNKFPSEYNEKAISDLESAWESLNKRTEDREARNVEGKNEA